MNAKFTTEALHMIALHSADNLQPASQRMPTLHPWGSQGTSLTAILRGPGHGPSAHPSGRVQQAVHGWGRRGVHLAAAGGGQAAATG